MKGNVERNKRTSIVREIAHIEFPHLTALFLFENCIESVECLPSMQLPLLRKLIISTHDLIQLATGSGASGS